MKEQIISAEEIMRRTTSIGRWVIKSIHGVETLYSTNLGSLLRFNVKGTTMIGTNFFNNTNPFGPAQTIGIRIDNGVWHHFQTNKMPKSFQISTQSHLAEIMLVGNSDLDDVWNEQQGFALISLNLDLSGRISPAEPRKNVTFIGDSITAGCWVNGHRASQDYAADANYTAICADLLNLDVCRIAYSAAGIIRPGTGNVPAAPDFINNIDNDTPWHPDSTDAVVINIGVNDRQFSVKDFEVALNNFLRQVQTSFNAPLIVMIPFAQTNAETFRQVAKLMDAQLVETEGWRISYTDQLHPNAAGSITAGTKLAAALKSMI